MDFPVRSARSIPDFTTTDLPARYSDSPDGSNLTVEVTSILDSDASLLLNSTVTAEGGCPILAAAGGFDLTNRARGVTRSHRPKRSKAKPKSMSGTRRI